MAFDTAYSQPTRPLVPVLGRLEQALSPFAEPLLRLIAGLMLVPHGAQKLFGWFGGYGLEGTGQFFASKLGLEPGILMAGLAGSVEFFAGLALAIGLLTRPAAGAVAFMMVVAIATAHWNAGFFNTNGGYEFALLWGVVAAFYVVRGGGRYSIDRLIGREI
jgi:putative oxidoreductase